MPRNVSSQKFLERFTSEERTHIAREASELVAEYASLLEVRERLGLNQAEVVSRTGKHQPAISRLESQHDMRLSTLREYVEEGLGGTVRVLITGPDGEELELRL